VARKTLAVAVAVLLTALALPYGFGLQAEKSYHGLLAQLSHRSGWQFTAVRYQRGWFSSTAETVIRYPGLPAEFIAHHHISHGPFPIERILEAEWRWTPVQAHITTQVTLEARAGQHAPELPPMVTETTLQLDGSGALRAGIAPLRRTGAHGEIIDWGGLRAQAYFDRDWKNLRLEARLPALTVTGPAGAGGVSLSRLWLQAQLQEASASGLFLGGGTLNIARLEFAGSGGTLGMQDLQLAGTAHAAGAALDLTLRQRVETIRTAAGHYGPGEITVEARHLDVAALAKFKSEIEALSRGHLPPGQAALRLADKTLELIGALSRQAPELELTTLRLKTEHGEIRGAAKVVLDGRKHSAIPTALQLLMALSGHGELTIPTPVLKELFAPAIRRDIEAWQRRGALTPQDLARLTPQAMDDILDRALPQYLAHSDWLRYFAETGGAYKLAVSIRRGQLLLNGQPWHASLSPLVPLP
jgi:uncharacterized protein YdgA (DUF945 family)